MMTSLFSYLRKPFEASEFAMRRVRKAMVNYKPGEPLQLEDSDSFFTGSDPASTFYSEWANNNLTVHKYGKLRVVLANNVHVHDQLQFVGIRTIFGWAWFRANFDCTFGNSQVLVAKIVQKTSMLVPFWYNIMQRARVAETNGVTGLSAFLESWRATDTKTNEVFKFSPIIDAVRATKGILKVEDLHELYYHPESTAESNPVHGVPSDFVKKMYDLPDSIITSSKTLVEVF